VKWRRKLIDPDSVRRERAELRKAQERLRAESRKVQKADPVIMGEVQAHKRLLRENNFARRIHQALGGAGG
jgi:hypothetical protein